MRNEFGKNGQSWNDDNKYIKINQSLSEYYKINKENTIAFSNYIYHKLLTIKDFKKKSNGISKKEFVNLLLGSLLLSIVEKERVLDAMPRLSKTQIDELIIIFNDEKEKFSTDLFSYEVANYMSDLAKKGELPKNHFFDEPFLIKTTKLFPNDTQLILNYCEVLEKKKDYDKAEEFYLKAIDANPKYENALGNLGFFYIQQGKLELAKKYLLKSVELGSLNFGNMNLGHVYFAEGDKQQAYETYKKSIENFEDKNKFFEGFDDDFQYLEQYGITKENFNEMKNKLAC